MVPGTRLELVHLAAADFESAASTDSATPARVRGAIIRHSTGSHKRMSLTLDDFDYPLPAELIAQAPLPERSASRLLVLDGGKLHDQAFSDLPAWLHPGDLLVFNDTRVIHARLHGLKDTGGQVEVLVERAIGPHEALAQVRASKPPRAGSHLCLAEAFEVAVLGRVGEFYHLRFPEGEDLIALLERHGKLPLPPYIERAADANDETRYQTIYARHPGSVAAPTAGLHFDEALMALLTAAGVSTAYLTLHVGAGTFQPVRVQNLAEHRMHREHYVLPAETVAAMGATRRNGGRIIAVGTTSLRALEAAAQEGPLEAGVGETDIFILPGFRFQVANALITNFHLPKSTLLILVSAFAGIDTIRRAYAHAIGQRYRFFSYGDAMFLSRRRDEV